MKDKYNSHNGLLGGLLGNKQLDKVYVPSSTLIPCPIGGQANENSGKELQGIIGTVEEALERLPHSVSKIPVVVSLASIVSSMYIIS